MKIDKVPTLADISPTLGRCLDEKAAVEHFLGKNRSDVVDLFLRYHEVDHVYISDFLWMGERAFVYYFPALLEYIDGLDVESRLVRLECLVGNIKIRCEVMNDLSSFEAVSLMTAFCEKYSTVAVIAGRGNFQKLVERFPREG